MAEAIPPDLPLLLVRSEALLVGFDDLIAVSAFAAGAEEDLAVGFSDTMCGVSGNGGGIGALATGASAAQADAADNSNGARMSLIRPVWRMGMRCFPRKRPNVHRLFARCVLAVPSTSTGF